MREIIDLIKKKFILQDVSTDTCVRLRTKEFDGKYLVLEPDEKIEHSYIAQYSCLDYDESTPLFFINCGSPNSSDLRELLVFVEFALKHPSDTDEIINKIKETLRG